MRKEILIVVPSRSNGNNREANVDRFIEAWKETTEGYSDLLVSLDDDDEHRYPRHLDVIYTVDPNVRFVPKLNKAALRFNGRYKAIAFFGDDHLIRTKWETEFLTFFEENNNMGIAYGNDLLQYDKLPTAVCMTSNMIRALGYMVPTQLQHMYADNFWLDLGKATNTIKYFPHIIFEHLHPDNGKAVRDAQYAHAAAVVGSDQYEYQMYLNNGQFQNDINKINNLKINNENISRLS
jgi:hypothetical protein